jgi:FdhD protein
VLKDWSVLNEAAPANAAGAVHPAAEAQTGAPPSAGRERPAVAAEQAPHMARHGSAHGPDAPHGALDAAATRRACWRSGLRQAAPVALGAGARWTRCGRGRRSSALAPWLDDTGWALLIAAAWWLGQLGLHAYRARARPGDPGCIVWDEVVAFWLVLWLLMPVGGWAQAAAFALFRFFDAAKPGPVGWADRLRAAPGRAHLVPARLRHPLRRPGGRRLHAARVRAGGGAVAGRVKPRLTQARGPLLRDIATVDEHGQRRTIQVPVERPLTVFVDKRELVTLMTLGQLPELLVLGYLLNQRLVTDLADLESVTVDWRGPGRGGEDACGPRACTEDRTAHRVVTTGCGRHGVRRCHGGAGGAEPARGRRGARLSQALYRMLEVMRRQDIHRRAGSVHGCALFLGAELLMFVEDVGRHNAIDTLAGWMAMHDVGGRRRGFSHHGAADQRDGAEVRADRRAHHRLAQRRDGHGPRHGRTPGRDAFGRALNRHFRLLHGLRALRCRSLGPRLTTPARRRATPSPARPRPPSPARARAPRGSWPRSCCAARPRPASRVRRTCQVPSAPGETMPRWNSVRPGALAQGGDAAHGEARQRFGVASLHPQQRLAHEGVEGHHRAHRVARQTEEPRRPSISP